MLQQGLREQPGLQRDKFFMLTTSASIAADSDYDCYFWGATCLTTMQVNGADAQPLANLVAGEGITLPFPVKVDEIDIKSGTGTIYYTRIKKDLGDS